MNGLAAAGRPGRLPGHAWPIRGVVLARARNGGHLRATRLFVRRAMPDLYFNRVQSLPATDDGSARPLTEDLSTGSGDGEDITRDADKTGTDEVPQEARTEAGPDGEAEFTEADVAFLSTSPGTG